MNALTNARTPQIVAAEINGIIRQTEIVVLTNSLQIGRLLLEAKEMLPRGEFGSWVKEEIGYSQTTANELMRLFNEYGADQGALFGSIAACPAYELLTKSQAMALIPIPKEEREQFIAEHNAAELSVRKLTEEVKHYKEMTDDLSQKYEKQVRHTGLIKRALDEAKAMNEENADKLKKAEGAQRALDEARRILKDSEAEHVKALEELKAVRQELQKAKEELARPVTLEAQTVEKIVEKVPQELQAELNALREREARATIKAANMTIVARAKDSLKRLQTDFNDFVELMNSVNEEQLQGNIRNAAGKIVDSMRMILEEG